MTDQRDNGIAWTDETWNPIRGCSRVSEGCRNCYAESVARRFSGPGQPYEGLVMIGEKGVRWNGTVRFVTERLADPLRWRRPRRVFVNSMSDLFHEALTNEQIAAMFGVMAASPQHTFQVLTKRAERMREWFRWVLDQEGNPVRTCVMAARASGCDIGWPLPGVNPLHWPLQNVWLGVSVEDQKSAEERAPLLLETPAAVRWVSYEPALEAVDFTLLRKEWDDGTKHTLDALRGRGIWTGNGRVSGWGREPAKLDWIVVGGESGPGARPFDLAWARSVVAQGERSGCKVFVKQLGAKPIADTRNVRGLRWSQLDPRDHGHGDDHVIVRLKDRKGGDPSEWPEDLRVREWPEVRV